MLDLDELEKLAKAATPGPWRRAHHASHEVEAPPNQLVADCGTVGLACEDATFIAAANPATIPDIIARVRKAERDLIEQNKRHGTLAEQDAEEAEAEKEWAAINAMSDDEVRKLNEAEGIDIPTQRRRFDTFLRALTRAQAATARAEKAERERDEARTALVAIEYADEEIRREYGVTFGLLDADDSPPCWADFARHIGEVTRERDEARAEREAAAAMIAYLASLVPGVRPCLPLAVPACYQDSASRFLQSVGLDGYGRRIVPSEGS